MYCTGKHRTVSSHRQDHAAELDSRSLCAAQVLHRSRTMFNMRNGEDLARFLADPRREDFDSHSSNLVRLQAERGYRPAWSWHMLRSRWGDETLAAFGIDQEDFS